MWRIFTRIFLRPKYHYVELYKGLEDIPLLNLEKVLSGKIEYIFKDPNDIDYADYFHVQNRYDEIVDAFNEALEIDIENDEYFVTMYKLIEARNKFIKGDKSAINFVRLWEKELEKIKTEQVKANYVKYRIQVQKWYGQAINPVETTGEEFIEMINLMKEEAEKIRSNGNSKED